ncbi:hypothetical protein V6N12_023885 [Hibiscus sabdariffa]|uniref:Leucine-rich repeat-containing N-terminal plant-type domain-containing protein n=1 Tax=Hibiscus sabdariffa TaxID=183260 RepID=A0ABR2FZ01_9ROSI
MNGKRLLILGHSQPTILDLLSNERLALMQFKESFISDKHACAPILSSYPKAAGWGSQGKDCCSWDGVECDQMTGVVIGLDLSAGCLYGSINSSSSLFRLLHLQKLNLAFNDFNHSLIPSALGNLSMLTLLELRKPDLKSLIQNLTNLGNLKLSYVDVASPVPSVLGLGNFSTLTSLDFEGCGLQGMFPSAIFQLPKLESIWLIHNSDLTGYLPEFSFSNKLKALALRNTSFSGELPASIGGTPSVQLHRVTAIYVG